ncbi:hypothetical protein Phum_PHUM066780 [Pediculus humanus corporis]|uniref:SEA domain-containing protein n=1 Tax=Pediculus humanus subsp. corporis TaxID=121224 RepID=E0VBQ9_PEDHC|nr:uncharacterized protein Phum_PHUM066780 [Pediculus humanus corporis]EEB10815.1 hypothetical protein Phum_PHUM066780 [Pediculus humanus corporis]
MKHAHVHTCPHVHLDREEHEHYYRVILKVNEPYREEYQDRSSPEYQSLQRSIVDAIEELYQSLDGRQSVNLFVCLFVCLINFKLGDLISVANANGGSSNRSR